MAAEDRTSPDNCTELLDSVVSLARDAGARILAVYNRGGELDVQQKDDRSPLTEADMAAHHAIVAGLGLLTPELPVLSEESAAIPFAERAAWSRYWLVDPLDGTKEFIKRNGEFTVNIALIDGHRSVLGVVYTPVSGLTYYACRGQGAFKIEGGGEPVPIHARPHRGGKPVVVGSRSHPSEAFQHFLRAIGEHEVISLGSSLKSCLVAEGRADIYPRLGLTSEWDTAAAQCVVEEAGGALVDTGMRPLRYNTKESLLNPHFLVVGDPDYPWQKFLPAA